ncbi:hypothetical protein GCM10007874_47580 [Labrys miyagiensis]|uniref:Uncharacterized protein n=1 Tax=Labrys miyagiensis TaxID=346912 RepID=A0ABQ6CU19_9HYPH|nr:hypothetical protein GCM10007874_47580 [Labrys miyagiensis]
MSTDYFPPIQRAVQGLLPNTQETRSALYEKARTALLRQLNAADPALTPGQISRERGLLEEAIRRVEHHYDEAELTPEPMASERPAAPKPASTANDTALPEDDEVVAEEPSAAPASQPEGLPAFAERRAEKRRPQAPRRNASGGGLRRYAVMGLVGLLIVGGGAATALYLRSHDDKTVLVPAQPAPGPQAAAKPADPDPAKLNDRLGGEPDAPPPNQVAAATPTPTVQTRSITPEPEQTPASPPPTTAPAPLLPSAPTQAPEGQRARMLEEDPTAPMKGRVFEGTVNWRTESQASGTNGPLETVVVGELNFPDRKMKALLTLRRNSDPAFPAAFLLQIQMTVPPDYPNGNVGSLSGVNVKHAPQVTGTPLDGVLMKVTTGVFLMGIADPFNEKGRNAKMLQDNEWFDVLFAFDNGRRAVITFEKGPAGDKVFNDAMVAWNNGTAAIQ